MANKYLKGGALNPAWCDEQDAKAMTESIIDSLYDLFTNGVDIGISLQLGEGVDISLSRKPMNMNTMCTIVDTESEYEAKFNFIKNHSGTPEDLKLAKEIIGLI